MLQENRPAVCDGNKARQPFGQTRDGNEIRTANRTPAQASPMTVVIRALGWDCGDTAVKWRRGETSGQIIFSPPFNCKGRRKKTGPGPHQRPPGGVAPPALSPRVSGRHAGASYPPPPGGATSLERALRAQPAAPQPVAFATSQPNQATTEGFTPSCSTARSPRLALHLGGPTGRRKRATDCISRRRGARRPCAQPAKPSSPTGDQSRSI